MPATVDTHNKATLIGPKIDMDNASISERGVDMDNTCVMNLYKVVMISMWALTIAV